jgi:hypothetical protein
MFEENFDPAAPGRFAYVTRSPSNAFLTDTYATITGGTAA